MTRPIDPHTKRQISTNIAMGTLPKRTIGMGVNIRDLQIGKLGFLGFRKEDRRVRERKERKDDVREKQNKRERGVEKDRVDDTCDDLGEEKKDGKSEFLEVNGSDGHGNQSGLEV